MKLRYTIDEFEKGTELAIQGLGLVPNGHVFEADPEEYKANTGESLYELVKRDKRFERLDKEDDKKKKKEDDKPEPESDTSTSSTETSDEPTNDELPTGTLDASVSASTVTPLPAENGGDN